MVGKWKSMCGRGKGMRGSMRETAHKQIYFSCFKKKSETLMKKSFRAYRYHHATK